MRIIILKNPQGVADTWNGKQIAAGGQYTLESEQERVAFANDAKVNQDIWAATPKLIINNGIQDLDVVAGDKWLKVNDPTPRDADGSPIGRTKTTQTGWHYEPRSLDFLTATDGSMYNKTSDGYSLSDGSDYGDTTMKFYDASGNELAFQQGTGNESETQEQFQTRLTQNCTMTIVDWCATYDYDIIGGTLEVIQAPVYPNKAYIWAVVAPDIPSELGGSVPYFAGGLPLHFMVNHNKIDFDGRGVKSFTYDPDFFSHKIRFIIKHEVGAAVGLNIVLDQFKA